MQAQATARAALKKLERKMEAIRGDLARAHRAPELRREAALLLCHLRAIPRGASEIRLLDESAEPAVWLEIALDPARTPQQLVEQRFERARKLERGLAIGGARLLDAEAAAERLRTFLARLSTPEALEQLTPEADMLGLKLALPSAPASRPKAPQRVPYRLFLSAGSQKILVGKGARDNDLLTLTLARPHDHWLHVRGAPGSHVVVPLDRGATIGQEVLLDAAHLAAHFSQERGEPTVDIAHTERRFVRKAKGAPAGQVKLERERVFALRIEPERLARLLAAERASR
jgi:predicted ribosome quality control (RQC) complex YloA/Tae2 family protein